MAENPYQAPVDVAQLQAARPSNRIVLAFVAGTAFGIALVLGLIIAAIVLLPMIVDIRENGPYWDEIERREKAGMTHEEAVESYDEERRARYTGDNE